MRRASSIPRLRLGPSAPSVLSPRRGPSPGTRRRRTRRSPAIRATRKPLAVGVLQLLAEFLGFGINLDADARGAELRRRAGDSRPGGRRRSTAIEAPARACEVAATSPSSSIAASSRSRPSDAPTPGSSCLVNSPAGCRSGRRSRRCRSPGRSSSERFEDRAGVVVEAAGDRDVERQALARNAGRGELRRASSRSPVDARFAGRVAGDEPSQCRRGSSSLSPSSRPAQHDSLGLLGGRAGRVGQSLRRRPRRRSCASLSRARSTRRRPVGEVRASPAGR